MNYFEKTGTPEYSEFIYKSRYAKWLDKENRRENWEETVDRYINFFCNRFPEHAAELQGVKKYILNFEVMPSMRALQTAGPALEKDEVAGYNCSYVSIDNIRAFDEMMYILMCGTGVGFSVERQCVNKLPEVAEEFYDSDTIIVVPDSKKGWATSFRELISLLYIGKVPKWDLSKLRPTGARLKTFGGRSSGPAPLNDLFNYVVKIFRAAKGRKLTSIECHDICCKIGEVVVSGGVRRSALLSLSNLSDDRMRSAKNGQWWLDNPQRALANNSASYNEKPDFEVFLKEWLSLYSSKSGERGIFSRVAAQKKAKENGRREHDIEFGTNPCCVGPDTLINTSEGLRKISSLEGKPFIAIVDGVEYEAPRGSWRSGVGDIYLLKTKGGHELELTKEHKVLCFGGVWKEAQELRSGDRIVTIEPGSQRYAAFESLTFLRKDEVWDAEVSDIHAFDANGIYAHNSEIILRPNQFCNLSEVVVRENDTLETLLDKVRVATILGTFQSTLTNFKYLRKVWKTNCEEERLLGVSLTGVMDHPILGLDDNQKESWLKAMKEFAILTNRKWADLLGINQSTAITCLKPSGTVSQLTNSASGIHARFSQHYLRRVRVDKKDPLCLYMIDCGYPGEQDVMNPNVWVFEFPIKAPDSSVKVNEISAMNQLKIWKQYQDHWCEHKPSCTIYYTDDEFMSVGSWVWNNFDNISGISFLPYSDHVYRQAPYEAITQAVFDETVARMPQALDWTRLSDYEKEDTTSNSKELACAAGVCEVVDLVKES